MSLTWILVLVTLMAGSKTGRKLKKAKDKKIIGRFTAGDFGRSDSEGSIDWDAISSDDDVEVKGPSIKEEEEETAKPPSPIIKYTRKRSMRSRGVHFSEPLVGPQSGHQESPKIGETPAPTQPSTSHEGESSQDTASLSSLHHDQQRLFAAQTKLATDFERVTAELRDVKKKQNSISRMVKKIYSLIGCSSSVELDSD